MDTKEPDYHALAKELAEALELSTLRLAEISEYFDNTASRLKNMHTLLSRELTDEAAIIRGAQDRFKTALTKYREAVK